MKDPHDLHNEQLKDFGNGQVGENFTYFAHEIMFE